MGEGEKRSAMGNKAMPARFDPLVQTISLLVRYCETRALKGEQTKTIPTFLGNEPHKLSEMDQSCLFSSHFYEKSLLENQDGNALGDICMHLSFEDSKFTKQVCRTLLKGLNEIGYDGVKPFYETLTKILMLNDSLQLKRFEWLFGFPIPKSIKRTNEINPCFGTAVIVYIDDEIFTYPSPLFYSQLGYQPTESILNLLWKSRKRCDSYCVTCFKHLLLIINQCPALKNFFQQVPPPTYQFKKYTDWIETYLNNYMEETNQVNYYSTARSKELGVEAISLFTEYKKDLEDQRNSGMFIFGKPVSAQILENTDIKDIQYTLTSYSIPYLQSQPNGVTNTQLPNLKTRTLIITTAITTSAVRPSSASAVQSKKVAFQVDEEYEEESTDEMVGGEVGSDGKVEKKQKKDRQCILKNWDPQTNSWKHQEDNAQGEQGEEMQVISIKTQNQEQQEQQRQQGQQELEGQQEQQEQEGQEGLQEQQNQQGQQEQQEQASNQDQAPQEQQIVDDCILVANVNNQSPNNIHFKCQVKAQSPVNFICPINKLYSVIPPKTQKAVCTLIKKEFGQPWGQMEITYSFKEEILQTQQTQQTQQTHQVQSQSYTIQTSDEGNKGYINCPECTYLNPATFFKCSICDSKLN